MRWPWQKSKKEEIWHGRYKRVEVAYQNDLDMGIIDRTYSFEAPEDVQIGQTLVDPLGDFPGDIKRVVVQKPRESMVWASS